MTRIGNFCLSVTRVILNLTQLLEAGVLESKRGYIPEEFKVLLNTFHIDPENGLTYKIVSIGVHRKKLVTVQRQLVNIQSGQALQQTDVVHALDTCLYYLLSNPKAPALYSIQVATALTSSHSGSRRLQRSRNQAHNGQGGAENGRSLARMKLLTRR